LKNKSFLFSLSVEEKRKTKVNIQMSRAVKTKNAIQCHSHHQKMVKKHGSVEAVIRKLQHLIEIPFELCPSRNLPNRKKSQDPSICSLNA
jgi:hypothetical protein